MPIVYKIDVLQALKDKGYNTNRIRKENLISEGALQSFREKKPVSWSNLAKLCKLLECEVGDIIEYIPDGQQDNEQ